MSVLALAAGAMPLLGMSPLLVALVAVATGVWLHLLRRPDAAVRVAVAVVLLPPGLLPARVQSVLELSAIVLAVLATVLVRGERLGQRGHPLPLAVFLLGAFVCWSALTLLWSLDPGRGTDLLRRYALELVLVSLVVLCTTTREDLDRLMGTLAAVGWLVILCGAYAVHAGRETPEGRLAVMDLNPNQIGNLLLLVGTAVLWRAVAPGYATRARQQQAAAFLACALILILLSGSRGSLIAYALLVVGLALFRGLRRWALGAISVAIVLLLVAPAAFGTVFERFRADDPEELSRTTLWLAGLALVADHPFGVGVGVSPYAVPGYVDARTSQNHFEARDHVPAHNPVIEVADDSGLIGAGLFLGVLVTAGAGLVATTTWARRAGDDFWSSYGTVVGIGSLAFGVGWMKSGGMSYDFATFVLLSLWLLAGRTDRLHAAGRRSGTPAGGMR